MEKIIYYTPEEVLKLVYIGANGKLLISKASLLNMRRRYFIPSSWVDKMLSKKEV